MERRERDTEEEQDGEIQVFEMGKDKRRGKGKESIIHTL